MLDNSVFALVALFILGFGAISGRITKSVVSPPMVFTAFGFSLGTGALGLVNLDMDHPMIHLIAEITLVLVLFTDASRINLKQLRAEHNIPVRLLAIGLPLTILAGTLTAIGMFPDLGIWGAAVLAVVLAPTDAALGQSVVSSPMVPVRIRQALNVESGLNDGIALPVLLLFVCLAASTSIGQGDNWLILAASQLTLGPTAGIAIGLFGGKLVLLCTRTGWMNESFQRLSSLGLALFAFAFAEWIGGNGFLAAFCAGLTIGNTTQGLCHGLYEFAEAEGQLLTLLTFLFFGAVMVPTALHHMDRNIALYAVLSLTVVRLVPVTLALVGLSLKWPTMLFLGWFGPRGIASILYGILVLEVSGLTIGEEIFTITVITVLFSVIAHGVSAWPASRWYGRQVASHEDAVEHQAVSEMPLRLSDS